MQRAEWIPVVFLFVNQRLAADQFIDDDVVFNEEYAVEAPASHINLTLEIQEIGQEISGTLAIDGFLNHLITLAGGFRVDALPYPCIQVIDIDRSVRNKPA